MIIQNINKTKEEQLKDYVDKTIVRNTQRVEQQLKVIQKRTFDAVWSHPEFTPQEILDVLGSQAALLFQVNTAVNQMISTFDEDYEPLVPNYEVTVNQDGTVTVGDEIPPLSGE